jgi:hypothetical protein
VVHVGEKYRNEWTRGPNGTASKEYVCTFDPLTEDEDDVELAIAASVPQFYRGYIFNSAKLREESYGVLTATVQWSAIPRPADEEPSGTDPGYEFSFQVATENVKQKAGFAVVSQGAASGKTAPDNGGLIGVTDTGVEGVDVIVPNLSFSIDRHVAASAVTQAYVVALSRLVGRVNSDNFKGFAPGEVLATSARGSIRSVSDDSVPLWSLSFGFSVSPNIENATIGGLEVEAKRGWDFLEIHYEEEEDTTNKLTLKKPFAYTVHQVYQYANFAAFGLG